jgi:hypothetical protein
MKELLEALKAYNEEHECDAYFRVFDDGSGAIMADGVNGSIKLFLGLQDLSVVVKWLEDNTKPQWEKDAEDLSNLLNEYGCPLGLIASNAVKEWFKQRAERDE